ncbi:MAG: UDP-N-acetylmuramoyl-L-alanyl-D-glutamate--2,6-diaminopimelate ligase [bacterium]|nr:UDP-N-acetylmuramoyl-L-alanyl-D-glutamate--2,6-diaminopimelate ligase [bacterium]
MQSTRLAPQTDSRSVELGDIFFALPSVSGRDLLPFVQEAFEKGAKTLVVDQVLFSKLSENIKSLCQVVPDVQDAFNAAAAEYFIPKPETLVAVTGTNGKTSVVTFVRQLWKACGIPGASLGTMGVEGYGTSDVETTGLTTADVLTLHKILQDLGKQGAKAVALEASSHGLHQRRLDGLAFSGAVFTNLSRDHLDYHKTEQDYFKAKSHLFLELLPPKVPAIICGDDLWGQKLIGLCRQKGIETVTYGMDPGNDWRVETHPQSQGQKISILGPEGKVGNFEVPFVGDFQALNVLASFLVLTQISKVSIQKALGACDALETVKGRLECVGKTRDGAEVFVDYAHTPDALARALKALRPRTLGELWVIFGCGGDRDAGKRSVMGRVAQDFADHVLVTDDNPRTENSETITSQILECGLQAEVIHDRKMAIETGISKLKRGDSLLIAGKGHEIGQVVGTVVSPFDDTQVALEALE